VAWVKTQNPTVFDNDNIGAITNGNVWGHSENKVGTLDIFPNAKAPACNFFQNKTNKLFGITSVSCYSTSFGRLPRQADTAQCPAQTNQKMQNIKPFAAMFGWPAVGVFGLE